MSERHLSVPDSCLKKFPERNIAMKQPLKVTQEAIDAYEKRTGFVGIGRKMIEYGAWVLVTPGDLKKESACRRD